MTSVQRKQRRDQQKRTAISHAVSICEDNTGADFNVDPSVTSLCGTDGKTAAVQ